MTTKKKEIQKFVTEEGKPQLLGKRDEGKDSKKMADLYSLGAMVQKKLKTTFKPPKPAVEKENGKELPGGAQTTTRSELRYFAGFKFRNRISFTELSSLGKTNHNRPYSSSFLPKFSGKNVKKLQLLSIFNNNLDSILQNWYSKTLNPKFWRNIKLRDRLNSCNEQIKDIIENVSKNLKMLVF